MLRSRADPFFFHMGIRVVRLKASGVVSFLMIFFIASLYLPSPSQLQSYYPDSPMEEERVCPGSEHIQIGGMTGSSSVENLVTPKAKLPIIGQLNLKDKA